MSSERQKPPRPKPGARLAGAAASRVWVRRVNPAGADAGGPGWDRPVERSLRSR